jgi:hypothetical protein
MNLPFSFEQAWMSQVSFCLNYNPDLKVGAKDRVPFKFPFRLFGWILKSAPVFQLVTSCKISTSL